MELIEPTYYMYMVLCTEIACVEGFPGVIRESWLTLFRVFFRLRNPPKRFFTNGLSVGKSVHYDALVLFNKFKKWVIYLKNRLR